MNDIDTEDAFVLSSLSMGSKMAFDAFFKAYYPKILQFVMHFCVDKQEAESLVQDLFMNLWIKRDKLGEVKNLDNYLYVSARFHKKEFNNGLFLNMKKIHKEADELVEQYKVLCKSPKQQVAMLSGGNIQKVVVAREFSCDPVLIIADQPTRGIDVGATEFIRKKLVELSRAGAAVLLVSADLNEVMELSDSLIILNGGRIVAYFEDTTDLTDEQMGEYMLGLKVQDDEQIRRVEHAE